MADVSGVVTTTTVRKGKAAKPPRPSQKQLSHHDNPYAALGFSCKLLQPNGANVALVRKAASSQANDSRSGSSTSSALADGLPSLGATPRLQLSWMGANGTEVAVVPFTRGAEDRSGSASGQLGRQPGDGDVTSRADRLRYVREIFSYVDLVRRQALGQKNAFSLDLFSAAAFQGHATDAASQPDCNGTIVAGNADDVASDGPAPSLVVEAAASPVNNEKGATRADDQASASGKPPLGASHDNLASSMRSEDGRGRRPTHLNVSHDGLGGDGSAQASPSSRSVRKGSAASNDGRRRATVTFNEDAEVVSQVPPRSNVSASGYDAADETDLLVVAASMTVSSMIRRKGAELHHGNTPDGHHTSGGSTLGGSTYDGGSTAGRDEPPPSHNGGDKSVAQ